MPLIRDASTDWSSPVVLTTAELWQCRAGCVFVSTETAPEADGGLQINARDGIRLGAGLVVRYRSKDGVSALIAREVVE